MALQPKLLQKLSQHLTMTPQLQHAIKLLQLGRLEYQEALEQELLENPILEELRDEDHSAPEESHTSKDLGDQLSPEAPPLSEQNPETAEVANKEPDWEQYLDNFDDYSGSDSPRSPMSENERPSLEATLAHGQSLEDHLISQIGLLDLSKEERLIAQTMVGNIDNRGYLCSEYTEIAASCGCSVSMVERVVEQLTGLDPVGVLARNLQECLLVQLDRLGKAESLEGKIVRHHMDRLQDKKYEQIAKKESVSIQEVYRAVQTIQKLEPNPGRPFFEENTRYVIPDIYVQKVSGEYIVLLNDDGLPKLRISRYYMQLLKAPDGINSTNRSYLQERLKAATWLIKSIQQRQNTILRVAESIVKFQREFLDNGIERLKPLVLKEVADDINMHESTVSRVTTNKFMHTSQGIFELKFFFTTGIRTSEGEVSSSAIKEKIRSLISQESSSDPISDQRIVEILNDSKVIIARRTVAKYRESMGILASSRRKKVF